MRVDNLPQKKNEPPRDFRDVLPVVEIHAIALSARSRRAESEYRRPVRCPKSKDSWQVPQGELKETEDRHNENPPRNEKGAFVAAATATPPEARIRTEGKTKREEGVHQKVCKGEDETNLELAFCVLNPAIRSMAQLKMKNNTAINVAGPTAQNRPQPKSFLADSLAKPFEAESKYVLRGRGKETYLKNHCSPALNGIIRKLKTYACASEY